jgi:hypothetical protein
VRRQIVLLVNLLFVALVLAVFLPDNPLAVATAGVLWGVGFSIIAVSLRRLKYV